MVGGFAGPGGPQAPYAEYQAWQPHGAPGGQPGSGPQGYAQAVNGGDYAYVIRHDGAPAPGAQQATAASTGSAQAGPVRAITSGAAFAVGPSAVPTATVPAASVPEAAGPAVNQSDAASQESQATSPGPVTPGGRTRPEAVPEVDPALAYGPDDPAYGPPGPDWYNREAVRTPGAEDAEPASAGDDAPVARGPFEPLRASDREATASADHQPGDYLPADEAAFDDPSVDPLASETSSYDDEISKLLGLGGPVDPDEDLLGQIRGMYDNAETVSETSLDLHFDQLLERQRQLITEYFEEAGGLSLADVAAAAEATHDPGNAESAVPFGFDTAESLASLRGELRGAQLQPRLPPERHVLTLRGTKSANPARSPRISQYTLDGGRRRRPLGGARATTLADNSNKRAAPRFVEGDERWRGRA
jgi:hypothetical protein